MIARNKLIIKKLAGFIAVFSLIIGINGFNAEKIYAAESDIVDIIFSTDIHSYLASYTDVNNGETVNKGGMARAATFINKMRQEKPELLLVDAGDYPMGTLYQTLFSEEAFEYRLLSELKYDAVTFGNHDFDYGSEALAAQFNAAKEKCDYYPQFPICNVKWDTGNKGSQMIYDSMKDMNLCDYAVIEKNGLKIGVTGVMGYDAIDCAPTCELEFLDPIEAVKNTVSKMKSEANPDMIVVLSHGGINANSEKSEDENIAKAVPDIDFIVSGHAHVAIPEYIKIGDTYIGGPGCYGEALGYAQFQKNSSGRFDLLSYELVPMDETVAEDSEILNIINEYDKLTSLKYLDQFGYKANQVIGNNEYDFSTVDDLYYIHDDHNLGEFIADAYRWQAERLDTGDETPVSVTIAPSGTIRATYPKGFVDVKKVYESFSLGNGLDGSIGYPLISIYVTGEELKTVCEIDATISELMNSANLYLSGLEFTFNPHRIFLNKVTDARLNKKIIGEEFEEIDPQKLYRVVTDLYSYRMLGAVKSTSMGLLVIEPKDKDGNVITDESQCVITDNNGNEMKAWIAIAEYMQSFDDDGDGIGDIPAVYDGSLDRKVIVDSKNILELCKAPNKFFFGIIGIVLLVVVVLVIIILLIIKIIKWIVRMITKRRNQN